MASLPTLPASLNMSACRLQAMSQVGCRLSVASSAKISLPEAPLPAGPSALTCDRKVAMSDDVDCSAGDLPAAGAGVLRSSPVIDLFSFAAICGASAWHRQRAPRHFRQPCYTCFSPPTPGKSKMKLARSMLIAAALMLPSAGANAATVDLYTMTCKQFL